MIYHCFLFVAMPTPSTNASATVKIEMDPPDDPMSDDEQVS